MVLLGRIELPTSPLPRVRSTTELQQLNRGGVVDDASTSRKPYLDHLLGLSYKSIWQHKTQQKERLLLESAKIG